VVEPSSLAGPPRVRIGAVTYLNSRPLVYSLDELAPWAEVVMDHPSRLADGLAAGRFDVALIPSIEYLRTPGYVIACDACVACKGPVRSIKLYGRVPVNRIRTLALDEGSRTSVAMTRILLKERYGLEPELERLPVGATLSETSADAAMLIGDRGMVPVNGAFEFVWDLGDEWCRWTGLPFVFAMWIARPRLDGRVAEALGAARDEGVRHLDAIARREAPRLGIAESDCRSYLRDHLRFRLGDRERRGLETFYQLAVRAGLAPAGVQLAFFHPSPA